MKRLVGAVLIMAVIVLAMSLTASPRVRVMRPGTWLATAMAPVSYSLTWIGARIGTGVASVRDLYGLQQENRALRSELQNYRAMKLELTQVLAQNGQLRSLLGLKRALRQWTLLPATVIARSPSTWFDTVEVDQGTRDGVRPGQAVIVPEGVVGRVVAASPSVSTVMLILDPKSGVGAMDARSQADGVLTGKSPIDGSLTFTLFSHHPDVAVGDTVVTSGLSQYYPKGILVGQVSNVSTSQYGLTETATVVPSVDFNRLSRVMIVLQHPPGSSVPTIFGGGAS